MARMRTLKPGFFQNDVLAEVEPLGRILFAGLWTLADREGRLEDRPKRIKVEILPYDDCEIESLLTQLSDRGFICRYQVDGNRYIQISNFAKHQSPHVKEPDSTIPPCVNYENGTIPAPGKPGASPVQFSSNAAPTKQENKVNSDNGMSEHQTSPVQAPDEHPFNINMNSNMYFNSNSDMSSSPLDVTKFSPKVKEIFSYWKTTLNHPTAILTKERQRKIEARLKEGYSVAAIKQAIDGCRSSPFHQGDNEQGKKFDDIELICRNGSKLEAFLSKVDERRKEKHGKNNAQRFETREERNNRNTEKTLRQFGGIADSGSDAGGEAKALPGDFIDHS